MKITSETIGELIGGIAADIGISNITVGYGLAETASWITMTRPEDPSN